MAGHQAGVVRRALPVVAAGLALPCAATLLPMPLPSRTKEPSPPAGAAG